MEMLCESVDHLELALCVGMRGGDTHSAHEGYPSIRHADGGHLVVILGFVSMRNVRIRARHLSVVVVVIYRRRCLCRNRGLVNVWLVMLLRH